MSNHQDATETIRTRHARDDITLILYDLFRRRGFEGASLSDISEATGLGRSSLYHHFPGGKDDMAAAVTDFARAWIFRHLLAPLKSEASLTDRIAAMLSATRTMYDGGTTPCLVASLLISPGLEPTSGARVCAIVRDWIGAIAAALAAEGLAGGEARRRATAAVIAIQGALVVARACGDAQIFADTLNRLQHELLA